MSEERRGLVSGILAYGLWGLLTVYWHELRDLPAFELIGQRVVWASLVLLIVLRLRGSTNELRMLDRTLIGRCAIAGVLLATNWSAYVWAVTHDNVVETALGYFMAPLGTIAIGVLVFGERLRWPQAFAVGLAALAIAVLTIGNGRPPYIALLLASTWSVYGYLKRTVPLSPIASLTTETFLLLPIAVALIVGYEIGRDGIVTNARAGMIALVVGSGIVTVVPLLLFGTAAPRVRFTVLGPLQYLVPTINFLLGVALYHESLPVWRTIGIGLVVGALVVTTIDVLRTARGANADRTDRDPRAEASVA